MLSARREVEWIADRLAPDRIPGGPTPAHTVRSRGVRQERSRGMTRRCLQAGGLVVTALLVSAAAHAQLFTLTKEQLIAYSAQNPFERFPDGRPKVPDAHIARARDLSSEDIFSVLPGKGFRNQYADGFEVLHPGTKLVGRAFTVQFMPVRPDVEEVLAANAKQAGLGRLGNQFALDQLQPGDVLVVDLFGKRENGTIVGDNLFYYVMKATKNGGLVVDGAVRDLDGISQLPMPAYFRHAHPTAIGNVMLTGVNIPVRIGEVTVMPGDLVVGDREGVYFIPPALVDAVLDTADVTHIKDEWTKKKFDEGKYKSSEIYGTPRDPELKKEYDAYLKKRLDELRTKK
jgi:4-hydroxy-4-methyl-2-oxoglutarate aldolase